MDFLSLTSLFKAVGRPRDFIATFPGTRPAASTIHGQGLFSLHAMKPGQLLCRLDGQAVALEDFPEALHMLEWNAISRTLLLIRPLRTSFGFLNHARRPNLAIASNGYDVFVAAAVQPGEELTLDYLAQPLPPSYLEAPGSSYLFGS